MHSAKTKSWGDLGDGSRGDRAWLHRSWDRWASSSVGTVLEGAALLNYFPDRPSRMFSVLAFQEGLSLHPPDYKPIVDGVKSKTIQNDYFWLDDGKYLVTSIIDNYFCARRMNSSSRDGEGAIIACLPSFILISIYEGSLGAAAQAMAATSSFAEFLSQRS